ncbi:hypothetical protein I6F15_07175 [Bradyrhizobium sp. BRP14]|nr:hypothetical protein [Bradyrhizobium sp. BRP14]
MFADALAGQTIFLTDEEASLARIEMELETLSDCDADDTVVIAFSGHGSETHELIVHDTGYNDITATSPPLERLQEWFSGYRRDASFCSWTAAPGSRHIRHPKPGCSRLP